MAFEFLARDECDAEKVLLKRGEEYFRVSQSLWVVLDCLQGGAGGIDDELAKYPVAPSGGPHPLVEAARELMAAPIKEVRSLGSPWGRIELDASPVIYWLAAKVGHSFIKPLPLGFAAVAAWCLQSGVAVRSAEPGMSTILVCVLAMLMLTIHELGHAVSAVGFGCRAHRIGLGFWFVFPVMYADVSEIWRLAPRRRIAVNLSGVAAQVWFGAAIGLVSLVAPTSVQGALRSVNMINLVSIVANLMPFGRLDGYWVLSDLAGVPDLAARSLQTIRSWFSRRPVRAIGGGRMDAFVSTYSAGALLFAVLVAASVLETIGSTFRRTYDSGNPGTILIDCWAHPLGWLLTLYVCLRMLRVAIRSFSRRGAAHVRV